MPYSKCSINAYGMKDHKMRGRGREGACDQKIKKLLVSSIVVIIYLQ